MNFQKATRLIFDKHSCVNIKAKWLFFIYVIIAMGIVLVPTFVKMTKSEAEFRKYYHAATDTVITINGCKLDWWSVTHFMLYIVLGFAFPHLWCLLLVCSITWEILEYFTGCVERTFKKDDLVYWCGKWSDLFVNTSGFMVGLSLRYAITISQT